MLQTIGTNAQAMLASTGNDALPAGFGQAQAEGGEFDLQLALQSLTMAPKPQAAADAGDGAAAEPAAPGTDAEQWLQSMLDQQATRVEAREGQPQGDEPPRESTQDDSTEPMPVPTGGTQTVTPLPEVRQADVGQALRGAQPPAVLTGQPVAAHTAQPAEQSVQAASLLLAGTSDESLDSSLIERLPSASAEADGMAPPAASSSVTSTATPATERTLKLHAPQAQWGEQMLQSLREHVDLQINQRIQNATIRLDPPELGSLEIYLSHESGRLSVQLSAANADVARLLQHTSERLRQELVGQNFVQVNVQVSADSQSGRQHEQSPRQAWLGEEAVQAARVLADDERTPSQRARDVLVTV